MISQNNININSFFSLSSDAFRNTFSKISSQKFTLLSLALLPAASLCFIIYRIWKTKQPSQTNTQNSSAPAPAPLPRAVSPQDIVAQAMKQRATENSSVQPTPHRSPTVSKAINTNGTSADSSAPKPSEHPTSTPSILATLGIEAAQIAARNARLGAPPALPPRESDSESGSPSGTAHVNTGPATMPPSMVQIADTVADNLTAAVTSFTPPVDLSDSSPANMFRLSTGTLNRVASNLSELPKRGSLRELTPNFIKDGTIKGKPVAEIVNAWRLRQAKSKRKITEDTFKPPSANPDNTNAEKNSPKTSDDEIEENGNCDTALISTKDNISLQSILDQSTENNKKTDDFVNQFLPLIKKSNPDEITSILNQRLVDFLNMFTDQKNHTRLVTLIISLLTNEENLENKKHIIEFFKIVLKYSTDNNIDPDLPNKICIELANRLAASCISGKSSENNHRPLLLSPVNFNKWYTLAMYFIELNNHITENWTQEQADSYSEDLVALLSFLADPQFHIDLSYKIEGMETEAANNLIGKHDDIFNRLYALLINLGLRIEEGIPMLYERKLLTIKNCKDLSDYIKKMKKT